MCMATKLQSVILGVMAERLEVEWDEDLRGPHMPGSGDIMGL